MARRFLIFLLLVGVFAGGLYLLRNVGRQKAAPAGVVESEPPAEPAAMPAPDTVITAPDTSQAEP